MYMQTCAHNYTTLPCLGDHSKHGEIPFYPFALPLVAFSSLMKLALQISLLLPKLSNGAFLLRRTKTL